MAQQQVQLSALIGGVIGLVLGIFLASYSVNNNMSGMMRMMGMNTSRMMDDGMMDHMGFSMGDMVNLLQGKTGDEFDELFIEQMIDHHQGAIEMAELAKKNAKHDEIKQLADDIISAQTKEIDQMQQWAKDWQYDGARMMQETGISETEHASHHPTQEN